MCVWIVSDMQRLQIVNGVQRRTQVVRKQKTRTHILIAEMRKQKTRAYSRMQIIWLNGMSGLYKLGVTIPPTPLARVVRGNTVKGAGE